MGRGAEMATPELYEFRIRGRLGPEWSDWFEGLTVNEQSKGESVLTGPVPDQAALHGILIKIRDLGLPLLSVHRVEFEQ